MRANNDIFDRELLAVTANMEKSSHHVIESSLQWFSARVGNMEKYKAYVLKIE